MSPRDDFRHQTYIELVDLANSIDEHVSRKGEQ